MDDGIKHVIAQARERMGYRSADEILDNYGLGQRRTVDHDVATDLARRFAPEAIMALLEIVQHGKDERARIVAAQALLDRGYGKALDRVALAGVGGNIVISIASPHLQPTGLDVIPPDVPTNDVTTIEYREIPT